LLCSWREQTYAEKVAKALAEWETLWSRFHKLMSVQAEVSGMMKIPGGRKLRGLPELRVAEAAS
jgi:hypothetical protein